MTDVIPLRRRSDPPGRWYFPDRSDHDPRFDGPRPRTAIEDGLLDVVEVRNRRIQVLEDAVREAIRLAKQGGRKPKWKQVVEVRERLEEALDA